MSGLATNGRTANVLTMDDCSILLLVSNSTVPVALTRLLRGDRAQRRITQCAAGSDSRRAGAAAELIVAYLDGPASARVLMDAGSLHAETGAPLLVVAKHSCESLAIAALRCGATDYFCEPCDEQALAIALDNCLAKRPTIEKNPDGAGVLVGNSVELDGIRRYIARVAATDCSVLITGETGTGKELVAQMIHGGSARAKRQMVCVNCAAIPDSLLESELFGYERGAFTGADKAQPGKLSLADGGTVFFDEIGDMSLNAQAKILRAIESRQVQRLGARAPCRVDVRIVSATNRDLEALSATSMFRPDLYFRLNVGRIHLTPLRERKEDILPLVDHLIEELNARMNRNVRGVTEGAMTILLQHGWPGNVRELKNVIEAVLISRTSGWIDVEDLPVHLLRRPPLPAHAPAAAGERTELISALAACQWNKSKTAEKLNWSRMTLYRKLAKYQLLSPGDAGPTGRGERAGHVACPRC